MNITSKNVFSKICAIIVIFALTISDFLFVGQAVVSYAIDNVNINSANIDFSVYFLNENGEKTEKLEENIDKGEKYLFVDISVKNEGYFNGRINLENNNFNIKDTKLSEHIKDISSNEVTLNQITAGSNITIKLAIEPVNATKITKNMLNSETNVKLSGQYVNSKNVEKDKFVEISGNAKVLVNWLSSENTKAELESQLLTNAIYTSDNKENRLVQLLVKSSITDNNYPVKNTNIVLSVPKNVIDVNVHSRSNDATNSNVSFDESNYVYDKENSKLTIKILNEDENNISWVKNAQDSFVVSYLFEKDENVLNSEINIDAEINTYDNKKLSAKQSVHINKEIDGIVNFEVLPTETSLYKGKLYTAEEKNYSTNSKIYVDYVYADTINLVEDKSRFIINNNEIDANVKYKEIKINKNEFLNLFGNDGFVTIKGENNKILANINSNSKADSEGNITVKNFDETVLKIETSKPIKVGSLSIMSVKAIKTDSLSREDINKISALKEYINGRYDENTLNTQSANIELKNTSSKAEFNVSTTTLSALEANKNVNLTTVLLNNDESRDLYKNPTIKITFPNQVTKVENVRVDTLYKNELEDGELKNYTENGRIVVEFKLNGTQSSYNTEKIEGTTINIHADIEINKLATNSDEEFILNYTNEIASSYEDGGEVKKSIKIATENTILATNNIKDLNVETIGNKGKQNAYLQLDADKKDYAVDFSIINNEGSSVNDVVVLGKFPTNGNLGATVTSDIRLSTDAKVYYSNNENATDNLSDANNNWNETRMADAKSYLIKIDKMAISEKIDAKYSISIPEKLPYNRGAEAGYTVSYVNELTGNQNTISSTILNITTGTGAEISANVKAFVGGKEIKDGDPVYVGEKIKYELSLKNTGTEEAKNINLEASIPNGSRCVKYYTSAETGNDRENLVVDDNKVLYGSADYYKYIEVAEGKIAKSIEKLAVNEEKKLEYEVEVEKSIANTTIESDVRVKYIGNANTQSHTEREANKVSNKVLDSDIKAELVMISRGTDALRSGNRYAYKLSITNLSNKNYSNVMCEIKTNEEYEVDNVTDGKEKIDFTNNKFKISNLEANKTTTFEIDVLTADKNQKASISAIINNLYNTNECVEKIELTNVAVSMKSENEGQAIKNGDSVVYNISIKNNGTENLSNLSVVQTLSTHLDVARVMANGENIKYDTQYKYTESTTQESEDAKEDDDEEDKKETKLQESDEYKIGFAYEKQVKAGESIEFNIVTKSDENYTHINDIQLSSLAEVKGKNFSLPSEEVNHILRANIGEEPEVNPEYDPNEGDEEPTESPSSDPSLNPQEEPTQNPQDNPEPSTEPSDQGEETYAISGTAWLDENEDGERNSSEKTMSGIKVRLINLSDSTSQETTTSSNGFYSFNKVKNGKYVAVFEYDTDKYVLTKYRAKDISQSRNSDVENVTMNIDGTSKRVASTDTLTVENAGVSNIDIGFVDAKVFDLKLSKTISKVSISNVNGTQNKEYNDANLAKMEIKAKHLSGTTVAVEYKIKVTNNGELAGYVRSIVDYKPSDLNFNSKLNSDWYQSGDYLYSTALANTKIEAGETKELTLVLTKTMTESNTGLTNNTAEIADAYNTLGINDINSTPNNKNSKENDQDGANLIISVSTGTALSYISITLSIIAVIAVGAYIVARKVLKANIKI